MPKSSSGLRVRLDLKGRRRETFPEEANTIGLKRRSQRIRRMELIDRVGERKCTPKSKEKN